MKFFNEFVYSKHWGVRIFRHVLFWSTDMISYLVVISANAEITKATVIILLLIMPLAVLVTYFIIYYIIPSYARDRNQIKLVINVLAALVFIGVGIRYYRFFIVYPLIDPTRALPPHVWGIGPIVGEIFAWMSVICMAIAIKVMKNKTELQQQHERLLEEKKAAELAFLKAQMHPHFLFNTLNTLYSHAIQNTGKSEQIVLHLSNLLRFMLEECNQRLIPIEKEIKVIDDYIELEKLRHGSRLQIDCQVKVNGSPAYISPLLLLPFVENSCKHTLSSNRGIIPITVRIKTENNFVILFVENDLAQLDRNSSTNGMGIANVKKQLGLLYGKDFILDIKNNNGKYTVNLKVPVLKNDEQNTVHHY
ncbi:MAG: histidine kinase [Bacteroidetes bacterium]|nr:histidine kinase [Bacteroidota bacterium]MBI3482921.1 histidine kinase [Bacteroidota bacterium]